MHIQPINSNINFQKRLVGKAKIPNGKKQQTVNIYHLDNEKDEEIFEKAMSSKKWIGAYYLPDLNVLFGCDFKVNSYYVMTDKKGSLLCASVVDESNKKNNELAFIETAPTLSKYNSPARKMKFIGETMLAFIAKKGRQEKKGLYVPNVADREKTKEFYFSQCGFIPSGKEGAKISLGAIDSLIRKNEAHTGGKIEIL